MVKISNKKHHPKTTHAHILEAGILAGCNESKDWDPRWSAAMSWAPRSAGEGRKRRQALRVWGVGTMEACDTSYDDAGRMMASDQEASVLTYSSTRW